jgi:hypothetical protein
MAIRVFACASAALAQSQPVFSKTELHAGFSTLSFRPGRANGENLSRERLNGFALSATSYQFFRRWGLTAEFGRHTGSPEIESGVRFPLTATQSTYLFGGTLRARNGRRLAITGRILAGATRWEPSASGVDLAARGVFPTQNAFTFGFGQSVDLKFNENLAFRFQPTLQFVRLRDATDQRRTVLNTPLTFGLVFRFGER